MAVRRYKPTTPGRRISSVDSFSDITKSKPEKKLTKSEQQQQAITEIDGVMDILKSNIKTSGIDAEEMKALATFHERHHRLNESLLKEAFQRADSPRLAHILFHLQALLQERNP